MATEITHVPERSAFVAVDGTEQLGVLEYVLAGDVIDLQHTVVRPPAEGRGVGSALVRAALDHAREHGYRVIPTCSFVPGVVARHPEYADLL